MSIKTNIWWINQFASLSSDPGGSRHVQLAKALQNYNCQTTIVCSCKNYITGKTSTLIEEKNKTHHSVQLSTGWRGPKTIGRYLKMVSFGNKVKSAKWAKKIPLPDIIIGSSPSLHAAMGGLKLAKKIGVPFILEIRDIWPASIIEVGGVSPASPVIKRLKKMESVLINESDAIITLLHGASEYYKTQNISKDKFTWIPNGIDLSAFKPENLVERDEVRTVMYSGAHGQANGLFVLIEAAGLLQNTNPEITFKFVGDGVLKPKLRQFALEKGINNVIFQDVVSGDKMPSILQDADVFVAQLQDLKVFKFGISPNKIYEYMAASKPIVFGTTAEGNPVTAADIGPVIEPGNPHAVAERIRDICNMKTEERKELGAKGRLFVKQNNTFEVLAKQVNSCIQEVLNK
jgi:glycosyltransferase involved in cell wall biosynthesis